MTDARTISAWERVARALVLTNEAERRVDTAVEELGRHNRELQAALDALADYINEEGAALLEQPTPVGHNGKDPS